MKEYEIAKKKHPDSILFFRWGDFYELFNENAEIASEILSITLTVREEGKERIPVTGFLVYCLGEYMTKMKKAGYQVAYSDDGSDDVEADR